MTALPTEDVTETERPAAGAAGRPSVVFLNRYYWPDVAATAQLLTDLAEDLAADGWDVTVIAGRTSYAVGDAPLARNEWHNGVRIARVDTPRVGRTAAGGRALDGVAYMAGALVRLLRGRRPDVIVAMTDPPLLVAPAMLVSRLRGARTVHWVQDLFPQNAAAAGAIPSRGLLFRILARFARRLHRSCELLVALGPQMVHRLVGLGVPPSRTAVVHNWADTRLIRTIPPAENPFLAQHGLEGKFVVLYSGNAGKPHLFTGVLEAMRRLRDDPTVRFVFIGGGERMPEIKATAERDGLGNAIFLGYVPRDQLSYSLSAAGASLVTESPQFIGIIVPSKTYGILASGRPVLFVGSEESDVARIVRDAECGYVVHPDDPEGLVRAIEALRDNPGRAALMGGRARRAAEVSYDRRIATARWRSLLAQLIADDR